MKNMDNMISVSIISGILETTTIEKVNYNHKRYIIASDYEPITGSSGSFDVFYSPDFKTSGFTFDGVYFHALVQTSSDGNFLFEGFLRGNSREGVIETIREDGVWAKLWLTKYSEFDSLIFQLEYNGSAITS